VPASIFVYPARLRPPDMHERNSTVFVVDDDTGVRNSLCFLLKSVGLCTQAHSSAAEFLQAVNRAAESSPREPVADWARAAARWLRGSPLD